jgi:hypothetical protein
MAVAAVPEGIIEAASPNAVAQPEVKPGCRVTASARANTLLRISVEKERFAFRAEAPVPLPWASRRIVVSNDEVR